MIEVLYSKCLIQFEITLNFDPGRKRYSSSDCHTETGLIFAALVLDFKVVILKTLPPLEFCKANARAVLYFEVVEPKDGNVIITPFLNKHLYYQ